MNAVEVESTGDRMKHDIEFAIRYALEHHSGQTDKSGRPYIEHLMKVYASSIEYFEYDYDIQIVAVLHDIIEDTNITVEDLFVLFGNNVATAVDYISRAKGETYAQYIDRVCLNRIATAVKYLDILDHFNSAHRLPDGNEDLIERYHKAYQIVQRAMNNFEYKRCEK